MGSSIFPPKKYGDFSPNDYSATFWHTHNNPGYLTQDTTTIGGISTDTESYLTNRGLGSGYDLSQGDKNLQPDYSATALNGKPGVHFATATSNPNVLSYATGRDFINNVSGLTVGLVLSLPTFTASQRIMRFNNNANNLSRLEILAITNNRIQVGGTRLNTDTVTSTATSTNAYTANTPFVLIAQLDFAGNALRAWINGTQVINNTTWLNGTGAGTNTAAENANTAQLGTNTSYLADWYAGEYCGFKSTLTSAQVATLTTYLKKGASIA